MDQTARRLQLARQYRQSKYVLEHILRPSQLHSGGGAWILIFAIRANDGEFFVSRMDVVAQKWNDRSHFVDPLFFVGRNAFSRGLLRLQRARLLVRSIA